MEDHWARGVIVDQPPHTKEMNQYNSRRKMIETGIYVKPMMNTNVAVKDRQNIK